MSLADCFLLRDELGAAERLYDALFDRACKDDICASLLAARAELSGAVSTLCGCLNRAVAGGRDGLHVGFIDKLLGILKDAAEAEQLPPDLLSAALPDIEIAEDVSVSITGPDRPPWYPALFRHLRARALALVPGRMEEALALDREALTFAKTAYPDLAPQYARTLAEHLLAAGHLEDARTVAEDHQPIARERGILREHANLLATEIAARARLREPAEVIDSRMAHLRDVLMESGSPRVQAEVLLFLVTHLPPDVPHPDIVALAEEAHALFTEMPIPAAEARCLEAAGDAFAARGRPDDARRRYLLARGRLERLGLALRLPLLERKIAATSEHRGSASGTA